MAEIKKKKKKKDKTTILIVLVLLVGVGLITYPSFSNYWNMLHQSRAIVDYQETVDNNSDEENQKMLEEAQTYNEKLAQQSLNLNLTDAEKEEYDSILDVTGTGIMGYISIESLDIDLPIYHDTTESVLQIAVGHLAGTSLPIGGNNTHSVLTGHTGLPSARLFTDIDKLKKKDTFQITVLNQTITYEVDDIRTVLPDEIDTLGIEQDKDLCTLVTCTPYGINTHRLLVTGHRIPNPKKKYDRVQREKERLQRAILLLSLIAAIILITIVVICVKKYKIKKNGKTGNEKRKNKRKNI
jgi:sortase A